MAETTTQPTTPIEQHSSEQFPESPSQNNKFGRHQKEQTPLQQSTSNLSQQTQYQQQFQSHIASQFSPGQNPMSQSQPPIPGQVQLQPPPPGLTTPQQLLTRPPEFIANKIDATPPPQFHVIQANSNSSTITKVETSTMPKPVVVTSTTTQNHIQVKKPPFSKKLLQPIYLLLRECLKEYITGHLTTKTEEDTKEIFNDRKKMHSDFQLYCTELVLESARDRILNELEENDRESLKDVSPESEIIKSNFGEGHALYRSFVDVIEELKTLQNPALDDGEDKLNGENEFDNPSEETNLLGQILRLWEQNNKNYFLGIPNVNHDQHRNRGRGHNRGYWPQRGGPRHTPYSNRGGRSRDWGARDDREFRERRQDDHYRDRREDYPRRDFDRRQEFRGPIGPTPNFSRERPPIGRRDDSYHRNYDDRRRNSYERRPDERHPRDQRVPLQHPHSIVPPKASPAIYEAPPMPPMPPNGPNPPLPPPPQPAYDYSQYPHDPQYPQGPGYTSEYNSQNYSNYYGQYQESQVNGHTNPPYLYPSTPSSTGWDSQSTSIQSIPPIQLTSFNYNQPGRHTAIPLPTNAPRLSMPEPHDVLGVIKGVIIRDAQGNIGLSQYQFNTM
ncbi:17645_t:CDS:2 [Funneliformis caledonium]|uniref:17645_t:CDS:1 n=1 Tax=Funneliformis caledonium TaxID=1117310 RepID=A0A9N9BS67_9GLOM|nr:17645_t:CDS:2 [Funneliformis caledonium]